MESPWKVSLIILQKADFFDFIFSLSPDNFLFKLEIVIFIRHTESLNIWISRVEAFGNFDLYPM